MSMNINTNAYGGYYSSSDFYQQKADVKKNPDTASTIGNKEMEAVLKEKDPELLGKIQGMASKIWNGDRGYIGFSAEYKKASEYVYAARKEMGVDFEAKEDISSYNEGKLSQKAQDYLKNLRQKYGDYDFMIGNGSDEIRSLSKTGSKEFSVILSNEEIERMANDEDYASKKLYEVENSVNMCRKICEQQGYESAFGAGKSGNGTINKITIASDDNGNMKFFAELEKTSEKQKERLEKSREKKAEDKKAEERRTHKKNPYEKENKDTVKRTTIEANSINEFLDKLENIDWNNVADSKSGDRFNFSA